MPDVHRRGHPIPALVLVPVALLRDGGWALPLLSYVLLYSCVCMCSSSESVSCSALPVLYTRATLTLPMGTPYQCVCVSNTTGVVRGPTTYHLLLSVLLPSPTPPPPAPGRLPPPTPPPPALGRLLSPWVSSSSVLLSYVVTWYATHGIPPRVTSLALYWCHYSLLPVEG